MTTLGGLDCLLQHWNNRVQPWMTEHEDGHGFISSDVIS